MSDKKDAWSERAASYVSEALRRKEKAREEASRVGEEVLGVVGEREGLEVVLRQRLGYVERVIGGLEEVLTELDSGEATLEEESGEREDGGGGGGSSGLDGVGSMLEIAVKEASEMVARERRRRGVGLVEIAWKLLPESFSSVVKLDEVRKKGEGVLVGVEMMKVLDRMSGKDVEVVLETLARLLHRLGLFFHIHTPYVIYPPNPPTLPYPILKERGTATPLPLSPLHSPSPTSPVPSPNPFASALLALDFNAATILPHLLPPPPPAIPTPSTAGLAIQAILHTISDAHQPPPTTTPPSPPPPLPSA